MEEEGEEEEEMEYWEDDGNYNQRTKNINSGRHHC